ncbi:hypothetical protein H5410_005444, partial [Solanum commersonii]
MDMDQCHENSYKGSIIDLGNDNCYLDYIIFLKENENIMWRKVDGCFLQMTFIDIIQKTFSFLENSVGQE